MKSILSQQKVNLKSIWFTEYTQVEAREKSVSNSATQGIEGFLLCNPK